MNSQVVINDTWRTVLTRDSNLRREPLHYMQTCCSLRDYRNSRWLPGYGYPVVNLKGCIYNRDRLTNDCTLICSLSLNLLKRYSLSLWEVKTQESTEQWIYYVYCYTMFRIWKYISLFQAPIILWFHLHKHNSDFDGHVAFKNMEQIISEKIMAVFACIYIMFLLHIYCIFNRLDIYHCWVYEFSFHTCAGKGQL